MTRLPRHKRFFNRRGLVYSLMAGIYIWYAKTTSSTFLEAELAACIMKCSPFRAKLGTTRQELAYQEPALRGPDYRSPECKCIP